jgi:hypothetical protein
MEKGFVTISLGLIYHSNQPLLCDTVPLREGGGEAYFTGQSKFGCICRARSGMLGRGTNGLPLPGTFSRGDSGPRHNLGRK